MTNKLIIALDQGSSSSRALAVDEFGQVTAKQTVPVSPSYPGPELAEYNAEELFASQLAPLQRVLDSVGPENAAAIAVSSQRSTVVLWDKETGQALCPALTWQDGRASKEAESAPLTQEEAHRLTGLYKTPFYSAPKIAWCLAHEPQVAEAATNGRLLIGPVATYIIWRLTGGRTFAVDPALAQRMLLLNINTLQWDSSLLQAFGIDRAWLPEIRASQADYGFYEYKGARIPINVCTGDQQAALAAVGFAEGACLINYGTGAFLLCNTGRELKQIPGILTSVGADGAYMLEGPVNAAGSAFRWLKELGIDVDMKELDGLYQQSRRPVWFLPALGGLGAPYWDFTVSPVFSGLSAQTKKADIAAGALRGVAFLLADIAFYLRQNKVEFKDVSVSGGIAGSRGLLQFQSDLLRMPLRVCAETESSALGCAFLAAGGLGWSTQNWQTNRTQQQVCPEMEEGLSRELYKRWTAFVSWCRTAPTN